MGTTQVTAGSAWARVGNGLGWVGWALVALGMGCKPYSQSAAHPSGQPAQTETSHPSDAQPRGAEPADHQVWYVNYVLGAKVGYEQTTIRQETRAGRPVLRLEGTSRTAFKRNGQQIRLDMHYRSVEDLDGQLLEFELELGQGANPMRSRGRRVGEHLEIETITLGKTVRTTLPDAAQCGGFYAVQQSLLRAPLQPGQSRQLRALIPGFNVIGTTRLVAQRYEPVQLLTGTRQLLRIDMVTTARDGLNLAGTLWTDRVGQIHKQHLEAMDMESFLATQSEALDQPASPSLDLVSGIAVHVTRRLDAPHRTRRVRYRVQSDRADPGALVVSCASQQVDPVDAHTAVVTVWALRPEGPAGNPHGHDAPPSDEDLEANNWIQSDHPRIVAMAQEAAPAQADPWQVALALERYVHQCVAQKGYSQAFASAAEVAETREGDCSEHAVLLAALARARRIPARVAMGLVYQNQTFYYHMWNEVYVHGRWIGVDATLGQGGIGAAHIKLGQSSLHGASAFASFVPLLGAIGRLKIEIEDVE